MVPLTEIIYASLAGVILGSAFFYILWLSAKKLLSSTAPVLWFLGAWLFRMALAILGFYIVADGKWQLLLACLSGFMLSRWLISKCIDSSKPRRTDIMSAPSPSSANPTSQLPAQKTVNTGTKNAS